MRRRRAGRGRRHDRRRTPSGQLSRAGQHPVRPTAELLRHRRALVGSQGDQTLAESPLGALLARSLITAEERMAGQRFAWLYRLAIGRTHPLASDAALPARGTGRQPGDATNGRRAGSLAGGAGGRLHAPEDCSQGGRRFSLCRRAGHRRDPALSAMDRRGPPAWQSGGARAGGLATRPRLVGQPPRSLRPDAGSVGFCDAWLI